MKHNFELDIVGEEIRCVGDSQPFWLEVDRQRVQMCRGVSAPG